MNVGEMIDEFERLIDKEDTADFDDQSIVAFLNQATDEFIDRKHQEFEMSQKRLDDLRTIVVPDVALVFGAGYYALPADYRHKLRMYADVTDDTCNRNFPRAQMRYVQQDDWEEAKHDPFEKGKANKPIYSIDLNGVLVDAGTNSTINSVNMTYIKQPTDLDHTTPAQVSELPLHTHRDIVNIAVRTALEVIEQPRYQTHTREQIIQEN